MNIKIFKDGIEIVKMGINNENQRFLLKRYVSFLLNGKKIWEPLFIRNIIEITPQMLSVVSAFKEGDNFYETVEETIKRNIEFGKVNMVNYLGKILLDGYWELESIDYYDKNGSLILIEDITEKTKISKEVKTITRYYIDKSHKFKEFKKEVKDEQ